MPPQWWAKIHDLFSNQPYHHPGDAYIKPRNHPHRAQRHAAPPPPQLPRSGSEFANGHKPNNSIPDPMFASRSFPVPVQPQPPSRSTRKKSEGRRNDEGGAGGSKRRRTDEVNGKSHRRHHHHHRDHHEHHKHHHRHHHHEDNDKANDHGPGTSPAALSEFLTVPKATHHVKNYNPNPNPTPSSSTTLHPDSIRLSPLLPTSASASTTSRPRYLSKEVHLVPQQTGQFIDNSIMWEKHRSQHGAVGNADTTNNEEIASRCTEWNDFMPSGSGSDPSELYPSRHISKDKGKGKGKGKSSKTKEEIPPIPPIPHHHAYKNRPVQAHYTHGLGNSNYSSTPTICRVCGISAAMPKKAYESVKEEAPMCYRCIETKKKKKQEKEERDAAAAAAAAEDHRHRRGQNHDNDHHHHRRRGTNPNPTGTNPTAAQPQPPLRRSKCKYTIWEGVYCPHHKRCHGKEAKAAAAQAAQAENHHCTVCHDPTPLPHWLEYADMTHALCGPCYQKAFVEIRAGYGVATLVSPVGTGTGAGTRTRTRTGRDPTASTYPTVPAVPAPAPAPPTADYAPSTTSLNTSFLPPPPNAFRASAYHAQIGSHPSGDSETVVSGFGSTAKGVAARHTHGGKGKGGYGDLGPAPTPEGFLPSASFVASRKRGRAGPDAGNRDTRFYEYWDELLKTPPPSALSSLPTYPSAGGFAPAPAPAPKDKGKGKESANTKGGKTWGIGGIWGLGLGR